MFSCQLNDINLLKKIKDMAELNTLNKIEIQSTLLRWLYHYTSQFGL